MGQVACQTIDFGRGVCGTAAATKQTQLVPDVDAFPGHIACDGASKSEIVVPVTVEVVSPEEGGHVEKKVVGISELIVPFVLLMFLSPFIAGVGCSHSVRSERGEALIKRSLFPQVAKRTSAEERLLPVQGCLKGTYGASGIQQRRGFQS